MEVVRLHEQGKAVMRVQKAANQPPGIGPIEGSSFNCSLRRIDRSARRALNKRLGLSGSGLFAPTKGCRPAFGCESRMLWLSTLASNENQRLTLVRRNYLLS